METSVHSFCGLRIAVEGCGHGTLHAIYASVKTACKTRGWESVDLLIIGGDFQAVRNAEDLTVMSCPVRFREIGDFHSYYGGSMKAPYFTIFVGGNHEASSHLWELYYGGWVAPNIYYMGAANVIRLGGVRIAGMSGIWKGYNYNKSHHERLPYNEDDIKSIYHVRELDTRKLLQLRTQVDIGISHDWPRAIENHGNSRALFHMKSDFEQESKDGTLGSQAAAYVMDRLRPHYWFAAHMHCKFAATKTYEDAPINTAISTPTIATTNGSNVTKSLESVTIHNSDEIDLDMDEDLAGAEDMVATNGTLASQNQDDSSLDEVETFDDLPALSAVPDDLRAQLPAAFSRSAPPPQRQQPGQPTPAGVTNKTVRFLALDKCLPGRKFLQLLEVVPPMQSEGPSLASEGLSDRSKPKFEYDPEWLAITRVFAADLVLGDKNARPSQDLGEDHYRGLIEKEELWIDENVVRKGKLEIPENFVLTAPAFIIGSPEIISEGPNEYNNPQTEQFCQLVGIENKFFASQEERDERMRNGPTPAEVRRDGGFGRRGRGGGRGGGRGNRGRGRGRSRGRGW